MNDVKMKKRSKEEKLFFLSLAVILILQLVVLVSFAYRKAGFHEDELYTYYSSNRTAGLFVNDREWMEKETLQNEFVVLEGEQFRYGLVKQVQSWDVHPPLYYYIFHTACSLFPGIFTKWTGIGINLIAYVLSFVLLAAVSFTAATAEGIRKSEKEEDAEEKNNKNIRARRITLLTCLFWGLSSAVISGVLFIRMYQWLTVFVLLCLWLHLRAIKNCDYSVKCFLLPLSITVFLGFLTQYYYIIFHIFLGAGFCFLLLKNKRIKEIFSYASACALGLGGAILYYPSSLAHIFRGYRGTEAVSEFGDASNTLDRLKFFYELLNEYVMGGTLNIWLLFVCILGVTVSFLKRKRRKVPVFITESVGLMLFTAVGYFFTISKTALLLGETSNRYQLPVYGQIIFLLIYVTFMMVTYLLPEGKAGKKEFVIAGTIAVILLLVDVFAIRNEKVFFLYEKEKNIIQAAKDEPDMPVLVYYHQDSGDHIWWLADKLLLHDKVYLVSQQNEAPITEPEILESDKLWVYMADHEDEASFLEDLIENNVHLTEYETLAEKGLWTLYEVR